MSIIKELLAMPKCGIWCLVNHRTKRILIRESEHILESFIRTYKQIKDRTYSSDDIMEDLDNLEFKVLDENINIVWRLFFYHAIRKWYKDNGYKICADYAALNIFVNKHLSTVHNLGFQTPLRWQVDIRTKYFKDTVGLFENEVDANEFIAQYYSNKAETNLVYAFNETTKFAKYATYSRTSETDIALGFK